MRAFLRAYRLDCLFFAAALALDLCAMPFLPERVPVQWRDGAVSLEWPKWYLLVLAAAQFVAAYVVRTALGRYYQRLPALERVAPGLDRLAPLFLSVLILSCQLCSVLAAFGVGVNPERVVLLEVVAALCCFALSLARRRLEIGKKP